MKIPKAPKFSLVMIGPGIVLVAMGLGSGEYILWPSLIAEFGLGLLWGAVVGVTLQLFVSNESGRYTLATGASVYKGFYKLNRLLPIWFIISTLASFAWPGIILSSGKIIDHLIGLDTKGISAVIMLIIIGLLLMFGGEVYNNLERFQKFVIVISIPTLLILAILLSDFDTVKDLSLGTIGIGDGFTFLPSGISIMGFLGAIAYSGAAGNLVLSHSFYVQDEGLGMAKYTKNQIEKGSKLTGKPEFIPFEADEENVSNHKKWMKLTLFEQTITFWFIGILSIYLLAVIAFETVYPYSGDGSLDFIFLEASVLIDRFGSILGNFFLIIGALFLFKTQLGIYETTTRILTENIQIAFEKIRNGVNRNNLYFYFLWLQIAIASAIALFFPNQPLSILLIATFFSALSMFVLSGLVLALNVKELPKEIRQNKFISAMLLLSLVFYGLFLILTVVDLLT